MVSRNRKVDILYSRAMGQASGTTEEEWKECRKYKVSYVGKPFATKNNISQYIDDVDRRKTRKDFENWCIDHGKGDRRMKDGSEKAVKSIDDAGKAFSVFCGWLLWGMALYWIGGGDTGDVTVGGCAMTGLVLSYLLYRIKRQYATITNVFIPIVLAVVGYMRVHG